MPSCRQPGNSVTDYIPAGLKTEETSVSSLSEGGRTNDTDFDEPEESIWCERFPDLITPQNIPEQPYLPPPPIADKETQTSTFVQQEDAEIQVYPNTRDTAVYARSMPQPVISPPSLDSVELASRAAIYLRSEPQSPIDAVADRLLQTFPSDTPSSEVRAIRLALDFGAELLRQSADLLARDVSARFGHMQHVEPAAILVYVLDELGVWCRHPSVPRRHPSIYLHRQNDSDSS